MNNEIASDTTATQAPGPRAPTTEGDRFSRKDGHSPHGAADGMPPQLGVCS
jgi:hypothetical protein